jgi:hypothetical protein
MTPGELLSAPRTGVPPGDRATTLFRRRPLSRFDAVIVKHGDDVEVDYKQVYIQSMSHGCFRSGWLVG